MATFSPQLPSSTDAAHVVAVPFPARGHINPMMNVCSRLASDGVLITVVVTEEYLTLLSPPPQQNLRLRSIPNVVQSEHTGSAGFFTGYFDAVQTKMEAPFDRLLDELGVDCPITGILSDGYLPWAVATGNRRSIPVFAMWMQTAAVFNVFHHFDLLAFNHHLPSSLSGREEEHVDYIPGIRSAILADLHSHCFSQTLFPRILRVLSWITKAQCILFNSCYELEPHVLETLRSKLSLPIYPIGPCIPHTTLLHDPKPNKSTEDNYFSWLDSQPKGSVLYVSLGTFVSTTKQQMDEIALGLEDSGVRYLWVVRENLQYCPPRVIRSNVDMDMGLIVPWCEQLRVLCHPSVGGFLTHCGWNSTAEGVYAGVPMLAFPLSLDQFPNSKMIVDDWKVGLRMKRQRGEECVVERGEIARLVKIVMGIDGDVSSGEMRGRVKDLQVACRQALMEDQNGSADKNLRDFIKNHVVRKLK